MTPHISAYNHASPAAADRRPDTRPGFYYVTVRNDQQQFARLRGPFVNDHAAALAAVQEATRVACLRDPRGHWYSYGTARSEVDLGPGVLDRINATTEVVRGCPDAGLRPSIIRAQRRPQK